MADENKKMTIDEVHRALNLYKIMDNEERAFIISYINEKPMYEIVEMIVHLSRGKDIEWIKRELGIREKQQENTRDER